MSDFTGYTTSAETYGGDPTGCDDPKLIPNANWQTKQRGANQDEYDIYCAFSGDSPLKTYDEWMNS